MGTESQGWPPVQPIQLEQEVRFPWSGGRHPCLDVLIETHDALIGVESKRYEPFRKRSHKDFQEAYSRPVWGEAMRGYEAVRDLLKVNSRHYAHLDAMQLIKHAFALRTATQSKQYRGKSPILFYLFCEPPSHAGGTQVSQEAIDRHRNELTDFAARVAGDEVRFLSCSYNDLVLSWRRAPDYEVRKHAQKIDSAFFGLFQNIERMWPERLPDFPFDDAPRVKALLETMLQQFGNNFQSARRRRIISPSRENWRWPHPITALAECNTSAEVRLERNFIRASERRRLASEDEYHWANQVPVASGIGNAFSRRRGIDLVQRRRANAFDFIELKIASDDPLSAARQIIEYGFLWLISRKNRIECDYSGALIAADDVRLCVLAPRAYYARTLDKCLIFQQTLQDALYAMGRDEGVTLGFEFQTLAGDYSAESALSDEALLALIENRSGLTHI